MFITEHEINSTKIPQSIQECCGNCVRILCFKQLYEIGYRGFDENISTLYNNVIESEKNCKLCGKSIHQEIDELCGKSIYRGINKWNIKLCSDCYIITSELIESTLVKKQISILYLPWWHNDSGCNIYIV
ncbi:hypothetical protein RhiirC2_803636 [Rhizophagus irregularis]|uniref:Uncharacterized protein n=1 Tax=Rhizophagus irregularis TaxID=588596 RepID=A0A2N1LEH0_9GLOM|nr:hypothetical protein RhiirC2_803636 [Rhizophagus irregularis]